MTRVRLRDAYSPERLAEIYAKPHNHSQWADHQIRVAVTIQIAFSLVGPVAAAADLSCGDAAVLRSLRAKRKYLGDYAAGYEFTGPIEETAWQVPHVNLFVCSETIEHLDAPEIALKAIRVKTDALVLSTLVGAWEDQNPEHYWAWDREEVESMLTAAGFRVVIYNELDCRPGGGEYAFGIWGAR